MERGRIRHKPSNTIFHVEIDREEDGRWLAEITDLPGVMAYGDSKDDAIRHVYILALRVLADKIDHDEPIPNDLMSYSYVHR